MLFKELRKIRKRERIKDLLFNIVSYIFIITAIIFLLDNDPGAFYLLVIVPNMVIFCIILISHSIILISDEELFEDYINLLEDSYYGKISKGKNNYSIDLSINELLSLKDNYMKDEIIRKFRNELIEYADNKEEGFNPNDDIKIKIISRISLFLTAIAEYPLVRTRVLCDKSISKYANICIMEKVFWDFMRKFENYVEIDKMNNIDWKWYFDIAISLPKGKRYEYIFETIVYDVLELKKA